MVLGALGALAVGGEEQPVEHPVAEHLDEVEREEDGEVVEQRDTHVADGARPERDGVRLEEAADERGGGHGEGEGAEEVRPRQRGPERAVVARGEEGEEACPRSGSGLRVKGQGLGMKGEGEGEACAERKVRRPAQERET